MHESRPSAKSPAIEDVLGPLGAAVMRAVWDQGNGTVASVTAALGALRDHSPAYTTVMTVMVRLADRGLLVRSKVGRRYVYRATDEEDAVIERLGRRAVDEVIARYGTTAYREFAARLADIDPELRARLADLASEESGQ